MSNAVLAGPGLPATSALHRAPALAIGVGLAVFGVLFHAEIAAAVAVWIESTAYNHCFLVIPIVLYLLWDRRPMLRGIAADPVPVLALAGIPLALIWLLAERLGIMEGRQLAVVGLAELLFAAVLGPRLWYAAAGPLLYLFFLVPVGEFLTPRLQDITTWFIGAGLGLLRIPAYIDGYTIEIPEGTFFVAEACAGLRFLIASVAFGCLYALLIYRSPLRRGVFVIVSLIVPVIANGFRALGIVVLGHVLGSAEAAAADHVLYGWLFFSLIILLLAAAGLPFRQDGRTASSSPLPLRATVFTQVAREAGRGEKFSPPLAGLGREADQGWGEGWKPHRSLTTPPLPTARFAGKIPLPQQDV
jgi:exosortase A